MQKLELSECSLYTGKSASVFVTLQRGLYARVCVRARARIRERKRWWGIPFWTGPVRDGLKRNSNEATRAPGLPGSSIPAGVTVLDR